MPAYASQHIQHMLRYVGIWQHMLAFVGICQHVPCQHMLADFGICSHMPECRRICNRVLTYADYVGMDYHIYQHMPRHANNCQRMLADARICKYGLVAYPNKGPHSLKPAFFLCAVHARFMRGFARQTMPAYAGVCQKMVAFCIMCQHMPTYDKAFVRICAHMLVYARICQHMLWQHMLADFWHMLANLCVWSSMQPYAHICQPTLAYANRSSICWIQLLATYAGIYAVMLQSMQPYANMCQPTLAYASTLSIC